MNKKTTKTETKQLTPGAKELIKTATESKAKGSKETINTNTKELTTTKPKTVSKSITTINHRSKEAQEIRETKFKNIIDLIETKGESLNKAAKQIGLDTRSFHDMIQKDAVLLHQYTRAMELRADLIAERMVRNSHNRANDFYTDSEGNLKPNPVAVQRDRLILDTDKWLLSKLMPKKYGDKLTLDGEVKTGNPLTIENINVILNELKEE
jgi:predicted HTH domain antitoxin